MPTGAITGYIDVAQIALYVFWLFFAGLVYYLHRENKREGYPLLSDRPNVIVEGFPFVPKPKTFLLPNDAMAIAPRAEQPEVLNAVPVARFPGAPFEPIGNPMLAGMGPGAYAHRHDVPDLSFDDDLPKIVPLRAAPGFFQATEDPEVIGREVYGLDGVLAGRVADMWIDRSEVVARYLEVELADGGRVLLPLNFMSMHRKSGTIRTSFITGAQFADVPRTKQPEIVTFLEEDMIMAYYGGGTFYAVPGREGPLL
jgi:photosynthetic reaction center H subunit